MTTYAWPSSSAFKVESCSIYLRPNTREFESQYSGSVDSIDLLGERLCMTIRLPACPSTDGALRSAFFNRLRMTHWISAYHFGQPQPNGTQRGTTVLSSLALQGASSLLMSGGTNGSYFEAGDMLGVGGELFQVADRATFNGSGLATVNIANRVRTATGLPIASAVTWDRPTAAWRLASPVSVSYIPYRVCEGMDIELIQAW